MPLLHETIRFCKNTESRTRGYVNNSRNLPTSRTQRTQGRNIPFEGTPDSDQTKIAVTKYVLPEENKSPHFSHRSSLGLQRVGKLQYGRGGAGQQGSFGLRPGFGQGPGMARPGPGPCPCPAHGRTAPAQGLPLGMPRPSPEPPLLPLALAQFGGSSVAPLRGLSAAGQLKKPLAVL